MLSLLITNYPEYETSDYSPCGSRETPWGTEYLFNVANGTTIYVTVTDGQAEFTQVVR